MSVFFFSEHLHDPSLLCSSYKESGLQTWLFWWSSSWAPLAIEPTGTAPYKKVTQGIRVPEASRLETIKWLIWKTRFSKEVTEVTLTYLSKSMACLCQGKWSRFLHWCHGRNIALCKTTLQQLADLFLYLWKEQKLTASAVKGCWSAFCLLSWLARALPYCWQGY